MADILYYGEGRSYINGQPLGREKIRELTEIEMHSKGSTAMTRQSNRRTFMKQATGAALAGYFGSAALTVTGVSHWFDQ